MNGPDLHVLAGITLEYDEPVFSEPWEAQAFAMVIALHQSGAFTWDEWADFLSREIHNGDERDYYTHWLIAVEKLLAAKKIVSQGALTKRVAQWHAAAARTPHGVPIEL